MLVQAIDKKTGNIMYQGTAKTEDIKTMYGDTCEYSEVSKALLLNSDGIMWSK